MSLTTRQIGLYAAVLIAGIAAPLIFPAYTNQLSVLWIMILFALTWDIMGGQMGYNSLGNIFFFGIGMYVCAVVQIGLYYDVGDYTSAFGAIKRRSAMVQIGNQTRIGMIAQEVSECTQDLLRIRRIQHGDPHLLFGVRRVP